MDKESKMRWRQRWLQPFSYLYGFLTEVGKRSRWMYLSSQGSLLLSGSRTDGYYWFHQRKSTLQASIERLVFSTGFYVCVWGGAGLGRWKVVTSKRVHYTRWVSSHKYLLQVSLLCSLPCPSSWVSSSLSFLFPPFHKTASLHPYSPLSDAQKCTSPQALLPHRFILSAVSVILRWLHSCSANKILKLKDPSPL